MKGSKLFWCAAVVLFLFCSSSIIYAQETSGLKIAYVDISRLFDGYGLTGEYDKTLEEKFNIYEKERNKRVEEIRDARGKLAVLKEEEKIKKEKQISQDEASLAEFDRQQQMDLRKERDSKIRDILLEIEKVIKEYAEKQNYDLILNDKVLVFSAENLDVTDDVLKLLNSKIKNK